MRNQTRTYPTCCTSRYCGSIGGECQACPQLQEKLDFEKWQTDTKAVRLDPYSPNTYTATQEHPDHA